MGGMSHHVARDTTDPSIDLNGLTDRTADVANRVGEHRVLSHPGDDGDVELFDEVHELSYHLCFCLVTKPRADTCICLLLPKSRSSERYARAAEL